MPRYQLLAVDIDGTLLNSDDRLTDATRYALVRAGRSGIHVVLATGRRYSRTLHLIEPLGIEVPLITSSGALVKDPINHRTLFCAEFDRTTLCDALAVVQRCGYDQVLCGDTYSQGFDFYCARLDVDGVAPGTRELDEYFRMNPDCGRIWPELAANPPPGVFTFFAMGTKAQMLELQRDIRQQMPGQLYTHVLRSPRYHGFMCEVAPAGATKWSAIERLATGWGIASSAVCTVGDDVNDVPMIRAAGLGVAMGNAVPEVKAAADRIAPTHDEDGLVEVVRWLLE
ncbi:MAG: Cof-type HAD-IIB family hydrolase [Candidatus Nealsonbacteria bacterium]|nr:Cof-type HAD-IIB family hydrolase [Candidatus Nealsonbacteria bacterium]